MYRLPIAASVLFAVSSSLITYGQSSTVELVPQDECIVELTFASDATFSIGDTEYQARLGETRVIRIRPLHTGQAASYQLKVIFPNGQLSERRLLLWGGQRVRLSLSAPEGLPPQLVPQMGHNERIRSVAFSRDGRYIATGSFDGTAIVWDAQTGRNLRAIEGEQNGISSVVFSPDGQSILTGSGSKKAILWDVETGRLLRTFEGHSGEISQVSFSPDGRRVLTGSLDNTVILWDVETGRKLRMFQGEVFGYANRISSVAVSPKGDQVLTGSFANKAILWDAHSGGKLRVFEHADMIQSVAFSPDGHRVVTAGSRDVAILWNADTGKELHTLKGHKNWLSSVAFSPDGKRLVTGAVDNLAILWDSETGELLRKFEGHGESVFAVAFSPDGQRILTGSADKTAVLWDSGSGAKIRVLGGSRDAPLAVAFSPDGRLMASGSSSAAASLWDCQTGRKLFALEGHREAVYSAAFSPDGRTVLTGSADGTAILWDAETGEKIRTFAGPNLQIHSLAFSPDGRRALTVSGDTAILWDIDAGQELRKWSGHAHIIRSIAYSPNGKYALTGSEDRTAILWDIETGQMIRQLDEHPGGVWSVAFSHDGRRMMTGSWESAVMWDVETGQKIRTFKGFSGSVLSLAYSPDSRWLLTGCFDKQVILWDVDTGQKLRVFKGHTSTIASVAFDPKGRQVLTGSWDGTMRLWDICTGDELDRMISVDDGKDWLVSTPEGLFDGSDGGREKVSYRIGSGLNVVPVERFFNDFYTPGLLAKICRGERPAPATELGVALPPKIRIISPHAGGITEDSLVTVEIEATDLGGGIQGPWLKQNGARLLSESKTEKVDKTVRQSFEVRLVEGENRIEVQAATNNEFATMESDPVVLVLRYEKPLQKPRLHLLAIGSNYPGQNLKLRYARQDAEALAKLFQRRGQTLYEKVNVHLLLDEQATKEGVRKILTGEDTSFAKIARPQDSLLVYLGGHGSVVGQRYFYIPTSFHRDLDNLETDIKQQGIAADVLGDWMAAVPCLKRMLIVDTCASGAALDLVRTSRNPFALRGVIERLNRTQGVFSIAAAAATQEAQEVQELGHGVLTYALLAGLGAVTQGPLEGQRLQSTNPDQVATVMEWFGYADSQVPRLMKKYFGQAQDVQFSGQGTSFPVLPLDEK